MLTEQSFILMPSHWNVNLASIQFYGTLRMIYSMLTGQTSPSIPYQWDTLYLLFRKTIQFLMQIERTFHVKVLSSLVTSWTTYYILNKLDILYFILNTNMGRRIYWNMLYYLLQLNKKQYDRYFKFLLNPLSHSFQRNGTHDTNHSNQIKNILIFIPI